MNRRGFIGALSGAAAFFGLTKAAPAELSAASGEVLCDVAPLSGVTSTISQYGFATEGDFQRVRQAIGELHFRVTADTSKFQEGLERALEATERIRTATN